MTAKYIDNLMGKEIYNEREKIKSVLFLYRSDKGRYGTLIPDLNKYAWKGTNDYPTSVSRVYYLMVQHPGKL